MRGNEGESLDFIVRDANSLAESGQPLHGQPLLDAVGRHLGEIVDAVVGSTNGRLLGLMVAREASEAEYVSVLAGLMYEDGRWTLLEESPCFRTTIFPASEPAELVPDASEDWMIDQVATRKLVDRQGRLIVEKGQKITAAIVSVASRAGMLHMLEGQPR